LLNNFLRGIKKTNKKGKNKMKKKESIMEKQKREIHVGIRMHDDEVAELDKYAARLRVTRSQLVRNLLISGLDDLKLAQAFGLISLVSFIRNNDITPQEIINLAMEKQGA
jgi:hypothetical protein